MITVIMAGLAPSIALLSFFYLKKQFDLEPIHMVIRLFLFGAILVFPIMVLQYSLEESLQTTLWFEAYISTGFLEEFFKWFILYFVAYPHAEFDHRYDGIVYSVSISLGFATVENIMYLWIYGVNEALMRALLPVSSHALFGVIMGYYLGRAKFTSQASNKKWLLYSLFIPIFLHGTYNYIFLKGDEWWIWIIIPFMLILWWYGLTKVKKAHQKGSKNSFSWPY
jgi:RsiW-degrading membrane proteinase PrsW (M82 family)